MPVGNAGTAFARFETLLTNKDVIAVAKTGKIFTPVITNVIHRSSNIYKLTPEGKTDFSVFNFSAIPRIVTVDTDFEGYKAKELLSEKQQSGKSLLTVPLAGKDAALFAVIENKSSCANLFAQFPFAF